MEVVLARAHFLRCRGLLEDLRVMFREAERLLTDRFPGTLDHSLRCVLLVVGWRGGHGGGGCACSAEAAHSTTAPLS